MKNPGVRQFPTTNLYHTTTSRDRKALAMTAKWSKWEKRCIQLAFHRSEDKAFKYLGYDSGFWQLIDGPDADPLVVMKEKGRSLTDEDAEKLIEMKTNSKRQREEDTAALRERSDVRQKLRKQDDDLRAKEAPVLKWSVYEISQDSNLDYETYVSAMVVASSKEEAKLIHPSGSSFVPRGWWAAKNYVDLLAAWHSKRHHSATPMPAWFTGDESWVHPLFVKATLICSFDGDLDKRGKVLCSSSTGC